MADKPPIPVVVGLFLATGALSVLVSLIFFDWVFDHQFASFALGGLGKSGIGAVHLGAAALVWRDVNRRRPSQLRGPKALWRTWSAVNTTGSIAYVLFGRRWGTA